MDLDTSQTICIRCGTTRTAQVDLIRSLFEPYGHVHTRTGTHGETQVECHVDMSFHFLLKKDEHVPGWVVENDECFWAFLAGYMDAEAHIGVKHFSRIPQARVEIASCDIGILQGLWAGLNERGVRCPKLNLRKRAGTVNRQGHRYNHDLYVLYIIRKASLDRLFQGIEPYLKHADKQAEMAEAWDNIRERGITVNLLRTKMNDERLENGTVIYWSRRFKDEQERWRVPVHCGWCGKVRTLSTITVSAPTFSGLCRFCAQSAKKIAKEEQM
jgi:hypothetical protein